MRCCWTIARRTSFVRLRCRTDAVVGCAVVLRGGTGVCGGQFQRRSRHIVRTSRSWSRSTIQWFVVRLHVLLGVGCLFHGHRRLSLIVNLVRSIVLIIVVAVVVVLINLPHRHVVARCWRSFVGLCVTLFGSRSGRRLLGHALRCGRRQHLFGTKHRLLVGDASCRSNYPLAQRLQKRDLRLLVAVALDDGARVLAAEQLLFALLQIELVLVGGVQTKRFRIAEAQLADEAHQNGLGYPKRSAAACGGGGGGAAIGQTVQRGVARRHNTERMDLGTRRGGRCRQVGGGWCAGGRRCCGRCCGRATNAGGGQQCAGAGADSRRRRRRRSTVAMGVLRMMLVVMMVERVLGMRLRR